MALLRLEAQDQLGIQVVVEVGVGLGVFDGRFIGVHEQVRRLSAEAIKEVLQETEFKNIKLVAFALPIFKGEEGIIKRFEETFQTYNGKTPVMIADQDMHKLALEAAKRGYRVSELNPADSHGVFGEYWQNDGPGVEERLAVMTWGLLTQHHAINPYVLDTSRYEQIDLV